MHPLTSYLSAHNSFISPTYVLSLSTQLFHLCPATVRATHSYKPGIGTFGFFFSGYAFCPQTWHLLPGTFKEAGVQLTWYERNASARCPSQKETEDRHQVRSSKLWDVVVGRLMYVGGTTLEWEVVVALCRLRQQTTRKLSNPAQGISSCARNK